MHSQLLAALAFALATSVVEVNGKAVLPRAEQDTKSGEPEGPLINRRAVFNGVSYFLPSNIVTS